jgi:hypothetical protein
MALVHRALRKPLLATAVIGGIVLLLAAPVLAVKTGPPSAEQLPESNQAREESELIADAIGPGWDAPFVVVAVSQDGPITEEDSPRGADSLAAQIADDPGVQAVIGPAQIKRQVKPLQKTATTRWRDGAKRPRTADHAGEKAGQSGGRGQTASLRAGEGKLRSRPARHRDGPGRGRRGADRRGIARVAAGAEKAVGRSESSRRRLEEADGRTATGTAGALSLEGNASELLNRVRDTALEQARSLRSTLAQRAAADPTLAARRARRSTWSKAWRSRATARNGSTTSHSVSTRARCG